MAKSENEKIDELYRALARKTHPDRNKEPGAAADFSEATQAFQHRSLTRLKVLARKYKIKVPD